MACRSFVDCADQSSQASKLFDWTVCCLGDELDFDQAVPIFVDAIFKRYLLHDRSDLRAADEATIVHLGAVTIDMWENQQDQVCCPLLYITTRVITYLVPGPSQGKPISGHLPSTL